VLPSPLSAPSNTRPAAAAAGGTDAANPTAHDESEGFLLEAAKGESVRPGGSCAPGAPVRRYEVAAIGVDITLNRYLDHDPQGEMFVLERDIDRVRTEEAANAAARADPSYPADPASHQPAVSIGLAGDAIQPLTLRVRQGECLQIRLHNLLPQNQAVNLHLHGSALQVAGGGPAVAANAGATAGPGASVEYEWMVGSSEQLGTYYFHSHVDERAQTAHGLFGTVIVEPPHATWLEPSGAGPLTTGWSAIVTVPGGSPFREFVLYYHEIGNESYQVLDRSGSFIPLVDPTLGAYRPDGVALNYRSEPFMNRMSLESGLPPPDGGHFDESLSYSSYAFGDPATPLMRSYVGDRVVQRIVHAGTELFHVHHVHGGSIRWHRQPGVVPPGPTGLDKHPPLLPGGSDYTDAQSIGPSETFDTENECGSGGCQQSVGDFLYHCHVAHHYFAGMWGIWRVYNTLQNGPADNDGLGPLAQLGDRPAPAPAVSSDHLIGTTLSAEGSGQPMTADRLAAWVQTQLPPRGVPRGYDAAVLDWSVQGTTYLNEPGESRAWPGYHPDHPGARSPILFDPATGKLAYPFLQPHLAKRPPFAPNHGPAPFLDPTPTGADPPAPGADGPASVCPTGTRPLDLAINAITISLTLNHRDDLVDPSGEIYVLRSQEDALKAEGGDALRRPLAIRANASQDCVDVLFRSELEDNAINRGFAKADLHIHFVQFDIQASDGVDTGFNYEQGVRPFAVEGEHLTAAAAAGATQVTLGSAQRFQPGELVGVGMDQDATFEARAIVSITGSTLVLDRPLAHPHGAGEIVSTEFVRYRWYPDVEFGTAYFHDHVNALTSWSHGLFGALIAEPPDASYLDPHTGSSLPSGPIADIHTTDTVSADVTGSFREAVLFIQDDNAINSVGHSSGSSLNLRAEPLDDRSRDPTQWFASASGDPETPVVEAYLADPVVFRTLVAGTNDVHTLHIDGHTFRVESSNPRSPPVSTVHLGISERFDLSVPAAGGPQRLAGDYLFYNGRSFKLREGSWGVLRVFPGPPAAAPAGGTPGAGGAGGPPGAAPAGLLPLPGHEAPPAPAHSVCPAGAPVRSFSVAAIDTPLPMLATTSPPRKGKVYVLAADEQAVASGGKAAQPLVLHVDIGDCIAFSLRNHTAVGPVSAHPDQLAFDPASSAGVAAGREPPQAVPPGQSRTYTWYASPQVGPTAALIRDWGDVERNPGLGLYGAVIVGPAGARYTDPATGADADASSSWAVDVHGPAGSYRDFSLFLQDEDAGIDTHRMPYTTKVDPPVGINYNDTPFTGARPAQATTPLLQAFAGDPVHVHVLVPWSEQAHVFSIENHRWSMEPGVQGATLLSSQQVGALEAPTLVLDGGAGGPAQVPGDYEYGDHREPYREAGMWGRFLVSCPGGLPIRPLAGMPASPACGSGSSAGVVALGASGAGVVVVGAVVLLWWRRRRRSVEAA